MLVVRILVGLAGAALVVWTLYGAVKTVILPRATSSVIARGVFIGLRRFVFDVIAGPSRSFEFRDKALALYAPLALLLMPGVWVALVLLGFTAIFWATGIEPVGEAFIVSGSSLLTLGFDRPGHLPQVALSFVEAVIGLGLVTLMISYLPSIYGAFSRREALVALLEGRAGIPPSPAELLTRYSRIGYLPGMKDELFPVWEQWFADIEESHTSQPGLVFFRSPLPGRSWITAAGCVLDTAAITLALVDCPRDGRTQLTLRTGFFALRRIADFFGLPYDPDPAPDDPISVTRREFDLLCVELRAADVPLRADLDRAWRDFAGWRVNYDQVLVEICDLVVAPPAKWSSDRKPLEPVRVRVWRKSVLGR
jgi:hypothetical protein